MMKTPRLFLTFGLFFVLLASACAPALTASPVPDASAPPSDVTVTSQVTVTSAPEATLAPTESALPVATSRGPDLHATDPATVALASGGLQLVEFFRFT
jgi:hypothetical protein